MIKEAEQPNLPCGKEYWKSLDSLAETPGFKDWVSREFPEGASIWKELSVVVLSNLWLPPSGWPV